MWLLSGKCKSKVRLEGKTAVVTGCSGGIGYETAKNLFVRGCHVIMACRDMTKTELARSNIIKETEGVASVGTLVQVRLDLGSFASVRKCAANISQLTETNGIHLLINNAGVGVIPKVLSEDGYELIFAVNHLGHFLLTLLLLPRILKSVPARIINVSSMLHYGGIDFDDINMMKSYSPQKAYNRSKLANILFTKELAKRLKDTGVTTYCLHPGGVNTDINRHVDSVWCRGSEWMLKNVASIVTKTPEQGAQTTIYCAVEEKIESHTGHYYSDCKKSTPSSNARDAKLALRLWDESLKIVKLQEYDPFSREHERKLTIPRIIINETPFKIE